LVHQKGAVAALSPPASLPYDQLPAARTDCSVKELKCLDQATQLCLTNVSLSLIDAWGVINRLCRFTLLSVLQITEDGKSKL